MRKQPWQSGFTLVEVLVATMVLAVGLLAVLTAFSMAARVGGISANDTTVSFLAQQKLAEIQASDPQELTPGASNGDFGEKYPNYSWVLTVQKPNEIHVTEVDLTIYAPEVGKTREFRFTTAVF